jgi:hypothetical protein
LHDAHGGLDSCPFDKSDEWMMPRTGAKVQT